MKIAILGYAGQGQSSYEYWNKDGNEITICDANPDINVPEGAKTQLGTDSLRGLDKFDLLIRTPILHPSKIVEANGPEILKKVTSNTDEFFRVCPTKNIIGVTGTKGKGTTSTLLAHMLEADGKTVHLGGNIGIPPLELLKKQIRPNDWVVLELANFQLIDLKHSPHIAVCLKISEEHLDWHENMKDYMDAKKQIFSHQKENDFAIYHAESQGAPELAHNGSGKKIGFMHRPGAGVIDGQVIIDDVKVCSVSDIKLLGQHNWQNVCAAITAFWQISKNIEPIQETVKVFSGLEHRLEFVREFQGVKYYDDSFGTNPDTAIVAIQAIKEPKVLILGGSDKGASFTALARIIADKNAVENKVKHVLLIGQQADEIKVALDNEGYKNYSSGGDNMHDIVANAAARAESGDVVLLSTGCASFGLFKNYKDRGEQFQREVNSL